MIRINATTDAVKSIACYSGATGRTGNRLDTDNSTDSDNFTLCVWWFQPTAPSSGEYTIWEFDDGANSTHAITVTYTSASNLTFKWLIGGVAYASVACSSQNVAGSVWQLFASFKKDPTTFGNSTAQMFCYRRVAGGTTVYNSTADSTVTSQAVAASTECNIGKSKYASSGSALGVMIGVIRGDVVRDGTAGSTHWRDVINLNQPIQAILQAPNQLVYAVNHSAQAVPWGGPDCRNGAAVVSPAPTMFDHTAQFFSNYYGNADLLGTTITGSPTHVDVYALADFAPYPMDRQISEYSITGLASSSLRFGVAPTGTPGQRTRVFARQAAAGAFTQRHRVGVTANSRAVYLSSCEVRTRAGTFTGITAPFNFNEGGMMSILGASGVIGFSNFPPPSGYHAIAPGSAESSTAAERAYGLDLPSTSLLPKVLDNAESASDMATGTYPTTDLSIARLWTGGRISRSNYTSAKYSGPGSARGIKAGYSYRILCNPHGNFVAANKLQLTVAMLNIPSSSALSRIRRRASTTQAAADSLGASDSSGIPAMGGSTQTPMAITAVAGSFAYDANNLPSSQYTVKVDDTANGMALFGAGDLIEVVTSGGLAKTTNAPDVSTIASVTGKGTSNCVITIYGEFKTLPTTSDYIACVDARSALQTFTVSFAAAEVATGTWRGLDIKAANDGRSGIILLCVDPLASDLPGIISCRIGWSGVGYLYQYARMHHTAHWVDGKSWARRVLEYIAPEVLLVAIADQGTGSSALIDRYVNWHTLLKAVDAPPDVVFAANGPEIASDGADPPNFAASANCVNSHIAMEAAAAQVGAAMVAWGYDPVKGVHHLVRYATGDDAAESTTHTTGAKEWDIWLTQLSILDTAASAAAATLVRRRVPRGQ